MNSSKINVSKPIEFTLSDGTVKKLLLDAKIPSHRVLMDAIELCAGEALETSFPIRKFDALDGRGGIDVRKLTSSDVFVGL
jgi:hypothetical protein